MTTPENPLPNPPSDSSKGALKALIPLLLAVLGVIFLGIGVTSWWKTKTSDPSHKGNPQDYLSLEVGETLPDLSFFTEEGKEVTLSEALQKNKIILLNFWASWCQACLIEMPALSKTRTELGPLGFEIFAINLDENAKEGIRKTRSRIEIPFPVWIDKEGQNAEKMDIHAIPVSVIINQKREVLWTVYGEHEWDAPTTVSKLKAYLE